MRGFSVKLIFAIIVLAILIITTMYVFKSSSSANVQATARDFFQFVGEDLSKSFGVG
jgi:uncharacterized protein (UPF0333 family)